MQGAPIQTPHPGCGHCKLLLGGRNQSDRMKTDKLYYRIFLSQPELLAELLPGLPPDCQFEYSAPVVKETEFRLDGLLTPISDDPQVPVIFVEAQMQRDPDFYRRFFAEVYLYQAQYKLERPWRGLLILYSPHQDLGDASQFADFGVGKVKRLYLADLITQTQLSPTLSLLQLLVLPETETAEAAQRLLNQTQRQDNDSFPKMLDLVEAILINKFPHLSMEEILAMLDLKAADIKQTRFYQEVYQEGQTEGYKTGQAAGYQTGEADLICHLFTRRFGPLSPEQQSRIYDLSPDQLKALAEALFDFSLATDLDRWLSTQV